MDLPLQPLTAEAFAPFGTVLAPTGDGCPANAGMARRFDNAVVLESGRPDARPNLAIFDVQTYTLPFALKELEQHPHSTQTFLPLQVARYATVVCASRPDGAPDLATVAAFQGGVGLGFSYAVGTWHHAIMALEAPARFAALTWENGSAVDCLVHRVDMDLIVTLPR